MQRRTIRWLVNARFCLKCGRPGGRGRDTRLTFQLKLSSLAAAGSVGERDEKTKRVDAKKSKFYTN